MSVTNRQGHTAKAEWKHDIKIAKQLKYPDKVIEALDKESDPDKRQRILSDARNGKYDDSRN